MTSDQQEIFLEPCSDSDYKKLLKALENKIIFDIPDFKKYLFDIITSAYVLGIAYVEKHPPFSQKEAIERFQKAHWEDLKTIWNIRE